MKLKRFKKKGNNNKYIYVTIICLMLAIMAVGISYAKYETSDEVQFINATVRWPKANEIAYTNTKNSSVTNVEQALNDLYGKIGK